VLGFFSSRPNWDPPPPHPQASVSSPFGSGGDTAGEGVGGPNSDGYCTGKLTFRAEIIFVEYLFIILTKIALWGYKGNFYLDLLSLESVSFSPETSKVVQRVSDSITTGQKYFCYLSSLALLPHPLCQYLAPACHLPTLY
jgi:hypothetical protein